MERNSRIILWNIPSYVTEEEIVSAMLRELGEKSENEKELGEKFICQMSQLRKPGREHSKISHTCNYLLTFRSPESGMVLLFLFL